MHIEKELRYKDKAWKKIVAEPDDFEYTITPRVNEGMAFAEIKAVAKEYLCEALSAGPDPLTIEVDISKGRRFSYTVRDNGARMHSMAKEWVEDEEGSLISEAFGMCQQAVEGICSEKWEEYAEYVIAAHSDMSTWEVDNKKAVEMEREVGRLAVKLESTEKEALRLKGLLDEKKGELNREKGRWVLAHLKENMDRYGLDASLHGKLEKEL